MKSLFLLSLILLSGGLWAQNYTVTLEGGNTLSCKAEPAAPTVLFCDDQGKVALVTTVGLLGNIKDKSKTDFSPVANIKDANGEIVTQYFVGGVSANGSQDKYTQYTLKATLEDYIFPEKYYSGLNLSPDYKSFREKFAPILKSDLDKLEKDFRPAKVNLSNSGKKIACTRKGDSSSENENACGIYDCGKGQFLFSDALTGTFDFVTIEKNGNWKFSSPESLSEPAKDTIYRNSAVPSPYASIESYLSAPQFAFFKPAFSLEDKVPKELRQNGGELFKKRAEKPLSRNLYDEMISECDPKSVGEIKKSLDEYDQRILNVELAQYVVKVEDVLKGYFISPDRIPAGAICDENTYYQPDAFSEAKGINSHSVPRVVSEAEAQELFKKAQGMDDIAWGFKEDGCYARAHLMARRFEEMGYDVDKAWIKGDLVVQAGDKKIEWNFHVAPVVYVRDKNGIAKPWIIDPSMMERAAPLEDWTGRMTSKSPGGTVRTTYPFPENAYMYKKAAVAISNSNPYLPDDKVFMSEAEKMDLANRTMREYKEYEE